MLERLVVRMVESSVDPVPIGDMVNVYFKSMGISPELIETVIDALLQNGQIKKREEYLVAIHGHPNQSYASPFYEGH